MNRKDRRAAGKGKGFGASGPPRMPGMAAGMPPSPAAALFAAAARALNAGRHAEAERHCRELLRLDPRHADGLHLLGLLVHLAGKREAGIDFMRRALAVDARNADCHFNLAKALQALGRLDEAALHFGETIAIRRDEGAAHLGLAEVRMAQGLLDAARQSYQRALTIDPSALDAHYGLANIALYQGRLDDAIAGYQRVLALKGDFAEAHNYLGVTLAAQGRAEEAAAHYRHAIGLRPSLVDAYRNLGRLLLAWGDLPGAVALARTTLSIAETEETKLFFVICARHLPPTSNDELHRLVARALAEGWSRPDEIADLAAGLFKSGSVGRAAVARAAAAWPQRLPAAELWPADELARMAGEPLLRALLETTPVTAIELERYLTAARAALLELAVGAVSAQTDDVLAFFCALARQCFINEYAFDETAEEAGQAQHLREALDAALAAGTPVPPLWPVAVASFLPLHALKHAQLLLQRDWPAALNALLDQQLREPLQEQELRASIPALTRIEDEVSRKVRAQYEVMPYPRWVKAAPTGRPVSVDWYLRYQFPLAPLRSLPPSERLDILIAGCGTGRHSIETARRFASARVLAADLSLSSLSYAKRKTRELGLTNIDYVQADLLALGTIGRSFDVIEASGVLHHLRDPAHGWRVLISLLRPCGVMHVGLYSALARADIRTARAFIAARGYGPSAADIRQCRQELLGFPDGTPLKNVSKYSDFFTVSDCRDLLIHVQEHQLTIPEIKAFLIDNNLAFLGFANPPAQAYRARFPNDPAMTDLDRWHLFETENPKTFVNMYQFWVQKPAGG